MKHRAVRETCSATQRPDESLCVECVREEKGSRDVCVCSDRGINRGQTRREVGMRKRISKRVTGWDVALR